MIKKKTYSIDEATIKLKNFCTYQERCHQEVQKKLKEMQMIPEAIDFIIVDLIQNNFLNEERYANVFVSGKFRIKKWGKQRLYLELKRRDISKKNIENALNQISDNDYISTLNELALKRVKNIKESNKLKKKKKLVDYLLYRGWESHLVYEKANELIR